jgi:short-subunit dehydrogenase
MMNTSSLAVVSGASSGIGLALARLCAQQGHDLVIAADDAALGAAAAELQQYGTRVTPARCDLSTTEGFALLAGLIDAEKRPVDVLCANAGRGLGAAFLDQDLDAALGVVHTNIDVSAKR